MKTILEQIAYFRDNRKNALCVVSNDCGKVIKTFPRTKLSEAVKWCADCVRVGMDVSMYDVRSKDGVMMVFCDKPQLSRRQLAQVNSKKINGEN